MSIHYVPARKPTPDIMGALLEAKVGPEQVELASIQTNGGTQPRAGINEQHVQDLIEAINRGDTLPAVDVYFDGSQYWLYDGFHRVEAHNRCRKSTILANIHQGTQADAQWASYGANPGHGLKRTNEDKKRAVLAALRHPNAASLSNVQIAAHVHVDEGTIRNYRTQMEASSEFPKIAERTVTRGSQTYTQNTANIGASQPQYAPVWKLEYEVREVCAQFYDADDQRHTLSDMRAAAKIRSGGFWDRCTKAIAAVPDITAWRVSDLAQAINNVASQMEADANGSDAQAEPVISLDELEVVSSATGPTGWTDPEPEHELDSYNDESPTVAARRMNKLHTLKVHFTKTIDLLEDFGELTGRHIATLAVGRELANLIDILEAEMDGLQKGINNHA